MKEELKNILENIDDRELSSFIDNTNSKIQIVRKTDNVSRDFSWLPIVEETIPYLDNIIRNPRRFIVQEEDIVIVEKAKKISTETIRHLAQNTNFIQDVDRDGMIKPSKVLNVNKEDTWDIYENRFIYTLVKELGRFIRKYTDTELENPYLEVNNTVEYSAESVINNENVKINLNLETKTRDDCVDGTKKADLVKRIEEVQMIVSDFENSTFIQSLTQALPVKSPIQKTNAILKDPNFQKALELWEFIMNSEIGEPVDRSTKTENLSSKEYSNKFDLSYFMNYLNLTKDFTPKEYEASSLLDSIIRLIEEYVDESDSSEQKLKTTLNNQVKSAIKKKVVKEKGIKKIYSKFIEEQNTSVKKLCDLI